MRFQARFFVLIPKNRCSPQIPDNHLPHIPPVFPQLPHHRRLEAAMHHALRATLVLSDAVFVPVGLFHHFPVARIMGVGNQVAGGFPSLCVAGRVPPRSAVQLLFPHEKAEIHGCGEDPVPFAHLEDLAELSLYFATFKKELLTHRLITEPRRHQEAVHADIVEKGKEFVDLFQVRFLEDGGIGPDTETGLFGGADPVNGYGEGIGMLKYPVMGRFHPIHVHVQGEIRVGPHPSQRILQQDAVGTEVDVFFPGQHPIDQRVNVGIEERFATGDSNDGRRTFIYRVETILKRHFLRERSGVFADASAAGAGEIAEMGGFQHENEGKSINPVELVPHDVVCQVQVQLQRETHGYNSSFHGKNKVDRVLFDARQRGSARVSAYQ